ncbi:murein hydrolase activator EnvC [Paenisporosarcina sp. TG20]|uniref:murein hydrolase activator EnvC family protein n=1 Tax=Paenisporosarcina sp. TG20 TaxID=1211706 RepID=UPI0002F5207E|nr:peptidoglycan DD-metalloendopeptidase family protein [Paenisporosarcina sp. TG20]
MKNKQPKWIMITIASVLGCSIFISQPDALASTLKDLQRDQSELEQKKNQLDSSINKKSSDITEKRTLRDNILAQIQIIDNQIIETKSKVDNILKKINVTSSEIEKLHNSILVLEKKITERDELIKERLRSVQESGGSVSYLDVLLGANSFVDFIDRFSAVNTLMDADRKIIVEQAEDKELHEKQKVLIEDKLTQQEQSRDKLISLKANLDSQKSSKDSLVDQLEEETAKLVEEKNTLEHENEHLDEVSKEIENKIVTEQARLIEVARQAEIANMKKQAEERARQEAIAKRNKDQAVPAPVVSSGTWTRPTTGRFSSTYGGRNIGSGYEFHSGSDIANILGTPIVSAANGIVSYAARMGTYGNVIMVTHSIDGQIFTTVYAHLSAINVSSGQAVAKGQLIGKMGSTGRSTGSHLHFEIHEGPWNGARSNAVNPIRYVSF